MVRSTFSCGRYTFVSMTESLTWIAVVDDDPSVLKSMTRTLRVHGFQTRSFESAQTFLGALSEGNPACLLVDVQMPGMTGLELIQHLRSAGILIPTIVITAHNNVKVPVGRAEFDDVVTVLFKPVRNDALFEAISAALGSSRRE
jgi:FixJ family two-component response regulator